MQLASTLRTGHPLAEARAHARWRRRMPAGVGVALVLALSANDASAAALGSLATSVGLLAALAILFVIKGLPGHLPASALPTAAGMLFVAAGAAWLWRARAMQRVSTFAAFNAGSERQAAAHSRAAPRRALPSVKAWVLPAGIEQAALLTDLRLQFVQLQAAWDAGDMLALSAWTTPHMLEELRRERTCCTEMTRLTHAPDGEAMRTDVITLQAELLGFEEHGDTYLVSVDFSGLIRESAEQGATPFRELWMLAKVKHGEGAWRLARHQTLL